MSSRWARCVLFTLALTAVVAPHAAAAPSPQPGGAPAGSIGVRLVEVPAQTLNDPRARLYIVDHLAPGTTIHRRIEVSNSTASTAHISLYAAGATIVDGSFLGAAGHTPNDLSMWTSVRPPTSDVPAGGLLMATVTITVPSDAAPGEQYGVVWAEAASAPAGGGVTQVNRVGIRLYLSVGPGGPPAADFTIDSMTAKRSSDGRPVVLATVHNTGGRALDMNGTLELLAGPGGLSAGPFPATLGVTLGIGDIEPITIVLDKQVPSGPWEALITLHSGLIERTAHAVITFPDAGASPPVKTTSPRPGWLYPGIAGLLLLLVSAIALVVLLRRRRTTVRKRTAAPALRAH